ncbi:hypothetical protein AOQ72_05400 [Bradyrhizobium yuanmingense]|uniref:Alanine dehydrogenase/pyridine nucleotide transhydrogenase NAD(H)-binding domain-containing protein n=1 Tax=Bradyrhizobium yuanmingense TaxID=108015 RepID=A0A0R3D597_9BRAD|nr:hypothetical protein AOQ72_05400 [Bradyrhizobium yuanmingense]
MHADPTYEVDGESTIASANMAGAVPLTSSQALNNATLPIGLALSKDLQLCSKTSICAQA